MLSALLAGIKKIIIKTGVGKDKKLLICFLFRTFESIELELSLVLPTHHTIEILVRFSAIPKKLLHVNFSD